MMVSTIARRIGLGLGAATMAALLGGCVIATESHPRVADKAAAGGATYCESAARAVASGRRATVCEQSRDGHHVACGGMATFCQQSSSGDDVACGGQASFCEKSKDGHKVACGGQASFCERSSDGNAAACGGQVVAH